ncbi:hypothetical protein KJ766_03580 [Patescibacteria group bacterium]|nr:hypothetical protein [Patescibacteria group bacterium]
MQVNKNNNCFAASSPSQTLSHGGRHYYVSLSIASCAVILFFCDPRVLLRTIIPFPFFAEMVGLLVVILLLISTVLVVPLNRINKYGVYIVIFLVLSMLRFLYAGGDPKVIIQGVPAIIGIVAITSFGFNMTFIRHLMNAFIVAMMLHSIAIYFPIDFIQIGLDAHTQYGASSFLLGRPSGFTVAPGVLALYSSIGLTIGIVMLACEKRINWVILVITSLLCGIGTTNRSFLIAFSICILLIPLLLLKNRQGIFKSLIIACVIALTATVYFMNSTYGERITKRFTGPNFQKDISTRLTDNHGILPSIKAVMGNPFLGSLSFDNPTSQPEVFTGERFVSPSNGYASIFATRGVFFGGLFVFLTLLACKRYWRVFKSPDPRYRLLGSALFGGLLVGQVVCIFDALLESYIMLMLLAFGLFSKYHRPKKLYIDSVVK